MHIRGREFTMQGVRFMHGSNSLHYFLIADIQSLQQSRHLKGYRTGALHGDTFIELSDSTVLRRTQDAAGIVSRSQENRPVSLLARGRFQEFATGDDSSCSGSDMSRACSRSSVTESTRNNLYSAAGGWDAEESYSVSDEGGSAVEGGGDGFAESDSGAERGHADGGSDSGEGGRGDVWGDVDETLSAVGSKDCRVCLVNVYLLEY
jgi:hypothetical protein